MDNNKMYAEMSHPKPIKAFWRFLIGLIIGISLGIFLIWIDKII